MFHPSMEQRITMLEVNQELTLEILREIKQTLEDSKTVIDKVASEVMPTLNSLMESPMLKMLLPKEKKR